MATSFALARKAVKMLPVSTFVHMTDEEDFGRPFPNTSPLFNSPTADLVLSSSNSFHFRVHRAILSEASPIFNAALATLPAYTSSEPPPVQDLVEDGDTISILLQYLYPMPNPQVTSLSAIRTALQAAVKYEVASAIDGLRASLVSPAVLNVDALGVYATACELGLQEEAQIASRATLGFDILAVPLETPCLENLNSKDFLRLVRLHKSRADAAISSIECMSPIPHDCYRYAVHEEENPDEDSPHSTRSIPADVRWWMTWKEAAIPEIRVRPRTNLVFNPSFFLNHVKRASKYCPECGSSYMSSTTQNWLTALKERIDSLPDTI